MWILPALGDKALTDVRPQHIRELLDSRSGTAPNTVRYRFFVLNAMFGDALQARYIVVSPCTGVPVPARVNPPTFAWAPELLKQQVEAFDSTIVGDVGLLIVGSAIRPVEIYATRKGDYDEANRSLYVRYPGRYVGTPLHGRAA